MPANFQVMPLSPDGHSEIELKLLLNDPEDDQVKCLARLAALFRKGEVAVAVYLKDLDKISELDKKICGMSGLEKFKTSVTLRLVFKNR